MSTLPTKGTHAHRILTHILRYKKLPLPVLLSWGIPSYSDRMCDLRKLGWDVRAVTAYQKKGKKTVRIVEYILQK